MWISLTLMSWLKRSVPRRRKLVHCSNPRLMSSQASSFFLYSFQAIFSKFSFVISVTCPAARTEFSFKPQISGASTRKPGIANQSALASYLLARLNQQPTTAPVGPSVHRMMGCVFFIWFLTLHCTTVNLFWLLTLTFFFWPFLFQPWPPFYPPTSIELHPSPTYQLTSNPPTHPTHSTYLPTFYLVLAKPLPLKKKTYVFS